MKTYICTKCNERFDEASVVNDHDPETWGSPMRPMLDELRRNTRGPWERDDRDPKEMKPYHAAHVYASSGGTQRMTLCGPLRPEDEGDEHIAWLEMCSVNSPVAKR